MSLHRSCSLLLMTTALFALNACKQSAVNLRFKPATGSKYLYSFEYNINQDFGGKVSKSVMKVDMAMAVTGEEGAYKLVNAQYNRFALTLESPAGTIETDTDLPLVSAESIKSDPSQMIGRIFHAIRHKPFVIKINQLGQVSEVKGLDSILDQIATMLVSDLGLPPSQLEVIRNTARSQFNESSIRDMVQQTFSIYPADPVKKGDSWTKSLQIQQGFPINMINKYTVQSLSRELVMLDLASSLEATLQDSQKLTGVQTGELEIDAASGMVKTITLVQQLKGFLDGMEMKMTTNALVRGKQL